MSSQAFFKSRKFVIVVVLLFIGFVIVKKQNLLLSQRHSFPITSDQGSGTTNDNQHYAIFGFIPPTSSTSDKQYLFDAAARTGKKLIRLDFPQFVIESQEGVFDWKKIDESVQMADQRGLAIEGILGWTSKWSVDRNNPHISDVCPGRFNQINGPIAADKFETYMDYIKQTVQRYPQITYWEVWNEPDIPRGFCGTAQDYAHILHGAYNSIKQTNPNAHVLIAGLTGNAFSLRQNQDKSWMEELMSYSQYDALHKFDIFNFHIYGNDAAKMADTISKIKKGLADKGRADGPLWITETGYPSDLQAQTSPSYNYGEKAQADFIKESLPLMIQSGADKVFMSLRDMSFSEGECKTNPHHQFCSDGLVTFPQFNNPNGRYDKPAMGVFQDL